MTTAPTTRSSGDTITAATENAVDTYFATALDTLTNANISSGAGITSSKLADRYGCFPIGGPLVESTSGADLSSPASFTLPTSELTVFQHTVRWHSSKKLFLYYVEIYVGTVAAAGINVYAYLNSTLLGAAAVGSTSSGDTKYLRNATHAANPFATLSDGDVLKFNIKDQGSASSARNVRGYFWLKGELGS